MPSKEQIDDILDRFADGFSQQQRSPVLHSPSDQGLDYEDVTLLPRDGVPPGGKGAELPGGTGEGIPAGAGGGPDGQASISAALGKLLESGASGYRWAATTT